MPEPDFIAVRNHLVDDVLGWWLTHGPDEKYGGVLTCWDNAGTSLVSSDKYTWSQGRWIWLTARIAAAARRGVLDVDPEQFLGLARSTATFVRDHAVLPDGTTAYVTDRAGTPRDTGQGVSVSVFADLFAGLGFAGLAQHDPEWGDAAERILLAAAERIHAGTYRSEPYPVPAGHASFALPMILLGVGEQVHRATGSERSLEVVRNAVTAIETTFVRGIEVMEMPSSAEDLLLTRHRAPGHTLEALWFLHHAADLAPGTLAADPERLGDLALHALDLDWDDEYGGLFRFVDREGGAPTGRRTDASYEALVVDTWDTKLWWPHAEAIYTTVLLAKAIGRHDLAHWHQKLYDYTMDTFPAGPGKEWIQIRRRDGRPLEATVALPVKDPFHIARSFLLLAELLYDDERTEDR
ncbi:AGE family epimerase/isomerase [Kribbella sp.]|uniref:AGE family epimerase/isomerase n=1 Tax=Kribbella sp. TaxID=1871183 RepID=UPI002D5C06AE|nr:AGE family epimerase/isomerase [Kribbella sp.]HZX07868.1 AGE family epimerase/isomerase [Kribbella sp.]